MKHDNRDLQRARMGWKQRGQTRPEFALAPGPGQESVWDYPRPPLLEPVEKRVRVIFAGATLADTDAAWRVCETASPPTYYLPRDDVAMAYLTANARRSLCEWKGQAVYFTPEVNGQTAPNAIWSYPEPWPGFEPIAGYLAFMAGAMDACYVGDDQVRPQPGGFYGGWITPELVGPFKGEPGTGHW
jgi:uncharacterized protein (DUF427 family)